MKEGRRRREESRRGHEFLYQHRRDIYSSRPPAAQPPPRDKTSRGLTCACSIPTPLESERASKRASERAVALRQHLPPAVALSDVTQGRGLSADLRVGAGSRQDTAALHLAFPDSSGMSFSHRRKRTILDFFFRRCGTSEMALRTSYRQPLAVTVGEAENHHTRPELP